jgi:OOP family OmpA-OmpF porin
LYFSRAFHPNNTGREKDPEDIWYTEFDVNEETWSQPIRLPGELNVEGPSSINSISVSGDTIIYSDVIHRKHKTYPQISYSVSIDGKWSKPNRIEVKNHYNDAEITDSYVSLKSGVILFAVQRADTYGSRDLYVSFWDGEHATEPLNMGGVINTSLEESSPFLDSDLKTLYFSSKGHTGYGGHDVFVTHRLDDSWTNWTQPENLGTAVNGDKDEAYFMITHCKRFAFFTKQISDQNTDIYRMGIDEEKKALFR